MPGVEDFEWVTDEQQEQLVQLSGSDWHDWLSAELDRQWPEWRQSTDEVLSAYLNELLMALAAPPDAGAEAATLAWVTAEQAQALDQLGAVRGDWRTWLPLELDLQWPEWRAASGDVLSPYLDQLLPTFAAAAAATTESADEAAAGDVALLGWVSPEQVAFLEQLAPTRGDWHDWLPNELDAAWPEWRASDPMTLGPWLGGLLPSLAPAATTADPSDLSWVTSEQAALLDQLTAVRGDWHEWLPVELDKLGAWRQSAADALPPWLDSILPTLLAPTDVAPSAGEDGEPAPSSVELSEEQQSQAEEVATSVIAALEEDPEMARLIAQLTPEELSQILNDVVAAEL